MTEYSQNHFQIGQGWSVWAGPTIKDPTLIHYAGRHASQTAAGDVTGGFVDCEYTFAE
jgi:hypothetical protein